MMTPFIRPEAKKNLERHLEQLGKESPAKTFQVQLKKYQAGQEWLRKRLTQLQRD